MSDNVQTIDGFSSVANFKTTLTYGVYSSLIMKFMDLKTELYRRYSKEPAVLKMGPEDKGVISRLVQELESALGLKYKNLVDLSNLDGKLPPHVADLLQDFAVKTDDISTTIEYLGNSTADVTVFTDMPRGIRSTAKLRMYNGMAFEIHNIFQTYQREGFTLAFNFSNDFRISICPEEKDGQKGSGEVYVYVYYDGTVYKDVLSKYVPTAGEILKFYRG